MVSAVNQVRVDIVRETGVFAETLKIFGTSH
jgi:hypothetical protein